jgi:hypothetical protein
MTAYTPAFTPEQAEASQGPEWLVGFVMNPPLWFKLALYVAAALVVGLAVRSALQRDLHISRDEQRSVALILATVEGVALGTVVSMWLLPLGYLGDVAVGLFVGLAGVEAVARAFRRIKWPFEDYVVRMLAVWQLLAVGAIAINVTAEVGGAPSVPGLHIGAGIVAFVMAIWLLLQEMGEGGVREALREV